MTFEGPVKLHGFELPGPTSTATSIDPAFVYKAESASAGAETTAADMYHHQHASNEDYAGLNLLDFDSSGFAPPQAATSSAGGTNGGAAAAPFQTGSPHQTQQHQQQQAFFGASSNSVFDAFGFSKNDVFGFNAMANVPPFGLDLGQSQSQSQPQQQQQQQQPGSSGAAHPLGLFNPATSADFAAVAAAFANSQTGTPFDSHSPSTVVSPLPQQHHHHHHHHQAHIDMFNQPALMSPSQLSAHLAAAADSPAADFATPSSYSSSVGGDSLGRLPRAASVSSSNPAKSQSRGRSSSSTRRKQSPPDAIASTAGGAQGERGRSNQRRSSSQVGKAPSSSARSRSARRNAAAYQAMGIGGAAAQATAAAAHAAAAAAAASTASPKSNTIGVLAESSAEDASRHPAFAGAEPGSPAWFASSSSPQPIPGITQKAGGTDGDSLSGSVDSVNAGWQPTGSIGSTSSIKPGKLEDVPEDDNKQPADNAAMLTEKRRKRRESHNAVERRRRDNINDRIQELATLLPEVLLEQAVNAKDDDIFGDGAGASGLVSPNSAVLPLPPLGTSPEQWAAMTAHLTHGTGNQTMGTAGNKPNKGVILCKSVEYIRYLQQLVELHNQRNLELERLVHELRLSSGGPPRLHPPMYEHQQHQQQEVGGYGQLGQPPLHVTASPSVPQQQHDGSNGRSTRPSSNADRRGDRGRSSSSSSSGQRSPAGVAVRDGSSSARRHSRAAAAEHERDVAHDAADQATSSMSSSQYGDNAGDPSGACRMPPDDDGDGAGAFEQDYMTSSTMFGQYSAMSPVVKEEDMDES